MFWQFIIPVLVQMLIDFLTELLKQLNPTPPVSRLRPLRAPQLPDLVKAKQVFLNKVWWRFWLGPKRQQFASALYDKMQSRFAVNVSDGPLDIVATVSNATTGLSSLSPKDLGA